MPNNPNRSKFLAIEAQIRALSKKSYIRYLVSGCFNTGLSFAIFSIGILLGLHYMIANAVAWAISVVVAFYLASHYVFQKPNQYRRLPIFVLSNLLSLLVSTEMLSILIKLFFVNPFFASIVSIPVVVIVNFFTLKHVVFR